MTDEEEEDVPAPAAPPPAPRDELRGYVGNVYSDVFKDLYQPKVEAQTKPPVVEADAVDAGAEDAAAAEEPDDTLVVDVSEENDEIAAVHAQLEHEHEHISGTAKHLSDRRSQAMQNDEEHARALQQNWGLTVREQVPVLDSELKTMLHPVHMHKENLILPRSMMADVERHIAIKSGIVPHHDNLLAISKPDEPNYLQNTSSVKMKTASRNIQPVLTQAQRTHIANNLGERKRQAPAAPPSLNAHDRALNLEIVTRMYKKINFLKNPRYDKSKGAAGKGVNPFAIKPESVVFRRYEVGSVYEAVVELRNVDQVGRRVRVHPCKSQSFAITQLQYESDTKGALEPNAVMAPGMAAFLTVRFAPDCLDDQTESLEIATELGNFQVPLLARRIQPRLEFKEPVHCGETLAGEQLTMIARITNRGGEGSFRFIGREADDPACQYETIADETVLVYKSFRVTPARFYLEAGDTMTIEVVFSATEVGHHDCQLNIETDTGDTTPITLTAISDAVRLELVRWPTFPQPIGPPVLPKGAAPLSMVPWQLNWLTPGAQVGCSESQAMTVSNGSYLPIKVQWRLVAPPLSMLTQLAVGNQQRLSQSIFDSVHLWLPYEQSKLGQASCPFIISPASATIEPFSTVTFSCSFYAYPPMGHRATAFAYLAAIDLPSGGHCLPSLEKLEELQGSMQPEGYAKGLPLFGGATGNYFDVKQVGDAVINNDSMSDETKPAHLEKGSIAVTAVCLQGKSVAPKVSCMPRVLTFAGDVLPFVSHTRQVKLKNTGSMPANFRFRLTSQPKETSRDSYDPVWVVAPHEVAPRRGTQLPSADGSQDDLAQLVESLATQWPPLPPDDVGDDAKPGFGAYVTLAIEQHEGTIMPGQTLNVSVVMRVAKEADLDVQLIVDLVPSLSMANAEAVGAPIRIPIIAAIRAPRVELRRTGIIDYGVCRAHSRQTQTLCVDNPSDMPMLVKLGHREGEWANAAATSSSSRPPSAETRACRALLAEQGRSNLPVEDRVNEDDALGGVAQSMPSFPMRSHQDVVDFYVSAMHSGYEGKYAEVPGEKMKEGNLEEWVHARSGTTDLSGRRKHQFVGRGKRTGGEDADLEEIYSWVSDTKDFIFHPAVFVLWPRQSAEVEVTLRTSEEKKFRGLLEASGFDSMHSQCIEVYAEVQLPRLRLSTQLAHFPVTYLKTASKPFKMQVFNDSDMPASFEWFVPLKLEAGLELQIFPSEGDVAPRGSCELQVVACPTRVTMGTDEERAELLLQLLIGQVIQPLALMVTACVYGPEVDWLVLPAGVLPPVIVHEPRKPTDAPGPTFPVKFGKAKRWEPPVDFEVIALGETKEIQLVLYNRTGIATPFAAMVRDNPAYDPLLKGRKIGSLLDAATRMYQLSAGTTEKKEEPKPQTFSAEPEPAAQGGELADDADPNGETGDAFMKTDMTQASGGSKNSTHGKKRGKGRFDPRSRTKGSNSLVKKRLLLDDAHERQAFRSDKGAEFAQQKEASAQGSVALKMGRGFAVKVEPSNDWLQPFSRTVITLKCFSDLPGKMEDEIILNVRQIHAEGGDYRIPVRLVSRGNPLYLPDQQIGLRQDYSPPRLQCGTIVPAEKFTTRTFKVGNNSSAPMIISWKVFPKNQLDNVEDGRRLVKLALCGNGGNAKPAVQQSAANAADTKVTENADEDADEEVAIEEMVEKLALEDLDDGSDIEEPPFNFAVWAHDPPAVPDPYALPASGDYPIRVEPSELVLPVNGSGQFTVILTGSKATATADNFYNYTLVGKSRFTPDRPKYLEAGVAPGQEIPTAAASKLPGALEVTKKVKPSAAKSAVAELPGMHLSPEEMHSDDSDVERPAGRNKSKVLTEEQSARSRQQSKDAGGALDAICLQTAPQKVPEEEIISTVIVNCVGDCISPMLTIDKKGDPGVMEYPRGDIEGAPVGAVHAPVFKFVHSAGVETAEHRKTHGGAMHGGAPGGSQAVGVSSCLVRNITFSNLNPCTVSCRFRIEGPFSIKQISQVGGHDIKRVEKKKRKQGDPPPPPDPLAQLFLVPKRDTISLQVEYIPDKVPSAEWAQHRGINVFRGDLVVEYPQDTDANSQAPVDVQRVNLQATSQRPLCKATIVPNIKYDPAPTLALAHHPPWCGAEPILIEFGYVHIETSVQRTRDILISNEACVLALWNLCHVGRKRRPAHEVGNALRDDEDFRASDDKDAFEFDVTEGTLHGPSKDGLVQGTDSLEREVHYCAVPVAQPRAPLAADNHKFEPQRIRITFKPTKNELYKCRFRIQVEAGLNIDIICRGCGSYDEEDDVMDFQEA